MRYKCLRCTHEYEDWSGPTQCPVCGHLYVKRLTEEK